MRSVNLKKKSDNEMEEIGKVKTPIQGILFIFLHPKTWAIVIVVILLVIAAATIRFNYDGEKFTMQKQTIPIPLKKPTR